MKLATIRHEGSTRVVRIDSDQAVLLPFLDVRELLDTGQDWPEVAGSASGPELDTASLDYAPLVVRPEKIFGIGLNYRAHAAEAKLPVPDHPPVFSKFWRSLIGAHDVLELPPNSEMVDWEAELGLVIGRPVRYEDPAEAESAIAGFTVINDVSMRDWQRRTSQFLQGKTFEKSTPVGPVMVTPDEVEDPDRMHVTCEVDGEVMQDAWTDDLVFKPAEIVSYLSQILTLVPGDLIATGTPGGVGGARRPQVYLRDGQVLTTRIEGVGEQVNRCVQLQGAES
jgi:acylpyruvate hydrolase